MIYTKPVDEGSGKITITGAVKTLAELMTAANIELNDATNEITLSPITVPAGINPVAWRSSDPSHVPAVDDGAVYAGLTRIVITRAQFAGFSIIKDSGADKLMFLEQWDFEGLST